MTDFIKNYMRDQFQFALSIKNDRNTEKHLLVKKIDFLLFLKNLINQLKKCSKDM